MRIKKRREYGSVGCLEEKKERQKYKQERRNMEEGAVRRSKKRCEEEEGEGRVKWRTRGKEEEAEGGGMCEGGRRVVWQKGGSGERKTG